MSSKVSHYRVLAAECCLKAARAENNSRRIHWLEAAARWVALGRRESAALTKSDLATVAKRNSCSAVTSGDLSAKSPLSQRQF